MEAFLFAHTLEFAGSAVALSLWCNSTPKIYFGKKPSPALSTVKFNVSCRSCVLLRALTHVNELINTLLGRILTDTLSTDWTEKVSGRDTRPRSCVQMVAARLCSPTPPCSLTWNRRKSDNAPSSCKFKPETMQAKMRGRRLLRIASGFTTRTS